MAHYLVTGGAGFIGSHLAERLINAGHEVTILDDLSTGKKENIHNNSRLIVGSITDGPVWDEALSGVDGVFHLAAVASVERSRVEWRYTHEVNIGGMVRLLEAISQKHGGKIPVVYASSAAIYGQNEAVPIAETENAAPATAYGADKYACELHAKVAAGVHGIPCLGLRFFNVYGPRQDPSSPYSGVISIFMNRIPAGQTITLYGDGEQSRDFIYVADVVEALSAAMRLLKTGKVHEAVCNVCTGKGTTLKQLIAAIESVSGEKAKITVAPARTGDIKTSLGDTRQCRTVLGITAATPLEQGLKATMESKA